MHEHNAAMRRSILALSLCVCGTTSAHQTSDDSPGTLLGGPVLQTTINMSAAIAAHAGDYPGSRSYPAGVLVSDEAGYPDDGLSLQAWSSSLHQPLTPSSWITVGADTHAGHGSTDGHDSSIEIEEVALSHFWQDEKGRSWLVSFGQQTAAPQAWLNWHADIGVESIPSLISDVFFARHRVDTGLMSSVLLGKTRLGINLWNGDGWPATAGDGAVDLIANYSNNLSLFALDTGIFVSAAKATERGGEDSEHSHSTEDTIVTFTGNTQTTGMHLGISSNTHSYYQWSVQSAILLSHESGELNADAQQAELTSNTRGVRLYGQITRGKRGSWLRHEWLSIDNDFDGPGGQAMAETANIADIQGLPSRTVLGAWWNVLPDVRWQLALQREYDGTDADWSAQLALQWTQQWTL